ncbi:MAG: Bax inhibitor-1/YccA family protein [bacterium]|nr:Bax inhibitor-1/YccA family protein [bacterium]
MYQELTNTKVLVERDFMNKVYGWMAIGLLLTAFVSYFISTSPALLNLVLGNRLIYFGLFIAEIFMVGYLSARINKMPVQTAQNIFIGYSLLNGLTLSFIFIAYTKNSLASTFFTTAGMFAAMSIYGFTTKKNLTALGGFLLMGLVGIIIALIINIFIRSSQLSLIISILGVFIFTGLTAYDTQRIKKMANSNFHDENSIKKKAILGALILYLDFINLFIFLLRLLGTRKN